MYRTVRAAATGEAGRAEERSDELELRRTAAVIDINLYRSFSPHPQDPSFPRVVSVASIDTAEVPRTLRPPQDVNGIVVALHVDHGRLPFNGGRARQRLRPDYGTVHP